MADANALIAALLARGGALSPDLERELKLYLSAARLEVEVRTKEADERAMALRKQRIRGESDEFARARGYRDWEDYVKRSPNYGD